jgi:hypothetical protein
MQVPIALSGIPRMTPKLTQIFALFRPCCNHVLDADRCRLLAEIFGSASGRRTHENDDEGAAFCCAEIGASGQGAA